MWIVRKFKLRPISDVAKMSHCEPKATMIPFWLLHMWGRKRLETSCVTNWSSPSKCEWLWLVKAKISNQVQTRTSFSIELLQTHDSDDILQWFICKGQHSKMQQGELGKIFTPHGLLWKAWPAYDSAMVCSAKDKPQWSLGLWGPSLLPHTF